MTVDLEMEQILSIFFQESTEGLDAMESGLLALDASSDRETINTIFRAAHSIKGGAATFGFTEISGFTHAVETLLDQMRDGSRATTTEAVQLLLQAVDVTREMVSLARSKQPIARTPGGTIDPAAVGAARQARGERRAAAAASRRPIPIRWPAPMRPFPPRPPG